MAGVAADAALQAPVVPRVSRDDWAMRGFMLLIAMIGVIVISKEPAAEENGGAE